MSTVRAALCFYTRGLVDALDQLNETAAGQMIIDFREPVGVNYMLSDSDHFHVATQYGCLIGDVPVRVALLYINSNPGNMYEQTLAQWAEITERHKVRGTLPWSELSGIKTEFKANCDTALTVEPQHVVHERERQERLTAAFGNHSLRNPCSEVPMTPTYQRNSVNTYRQNVRQHGNLITRRQGEAAVARHQAEQAAAAQWAIDWLNTAVWCAPGPTGTPCAFLINQMEPKHLWETICWLTANYLKLFQQYHGQPGRDSMALVAKRWLGAQPAFRALVQEAIRRRVTFPPEVFRYLREYMLERDTSEIAVSSPWDDPRLAHQNEELASFVDAPLHVPEEIDPVIEFGRDFRDIDIDDT